MAADIRSLRKRIKILEDMLAKSEHAISIYARDADLARKEADEQRRRRLDHEQEMAI